MNKQPQFILLGAGGHARVLLDCLRAQQLTILGAVVAQPNVEYATADLNILGAETELKHYPSAILINAIGSATVPTQRKIIFEQLQAQFSFLTIVHPSAVIATTATLQMGAQVMAGAIVQPAAVIGANTLINTRAVVDHDCVIADSVHIASGAVLAGGVHVSSGTHIGAGATIIQGIHIGQGCLIAAGALVRESVPNGARVAGVPARPMSNTARSEHEKLAGYFNQA